MNNLRNLTPFFGPLKTFQLKLFRHFNTSTPEKGNIYDFTSVPHFDPNFTFSFIDMLFLFIIFSKILTTFLSFMVPYRFFIMKVKNQLR